MRLAVVNVNHPHANVARLDGHEDLDGPQASWRSLTRRTRSAQTPASTTTPSPTSSDG